MGYLRVKDSDNLVRDTESHAIINGNPQAYQEYKKNKLAAKRKLEEEKAEKERINNLEQRMSSIEDKLDRILKALGNGNT